MASGNNFRYVIKTFKNHAHTILNDYYYAPNNSPDRLYIQKNRG